MASITSSPELVVVSGEISDSSRPVFERALDALRESQAKVPVIDLSDLARISSKEIGLLVTLWIDLMESGRRSVPQ